MINMAMFREMQNPDTPNLPFAQTRFSTMYRETQNPDTPDLAFAQTTNGCLTCPPLQLSLGLCNCPIGNGGNTGGGNTGGGSSGFTKSDIRDIVEEYHGDDIERLYRIHKEQEGRITSAYDHRRSIESKVEANISKFPNIHTDLSSLGKSVSDVSSALGIHKAEFDVHKTHDLIPNPFDFEKYIPYILIGGLALIVMRKKR